MENYKYRHCVEITPEQKDKLLEQVHQNWSWRATQNCASFASDVFYNVTGEDIDADSWLGLETPTELGDNIIDANGGSDSNEKETIGTYPLRPDKPDDDGCSTSK